jgi:hypothetical protein
MLPKPFNDFIPKFFNRDTKLTAFSNKIDELLTSFESDTLGLNTFIDPFRCPLSVLTELGYLLNAGLKSNDTERQKRIKVATAVLGHKRRGSFQEDAKPKIDNIAGGDSQIFRSTVSGDWILGGDGEVIPSGSYWGTMAGDATDDDLGLLLIGDGTELEVAGNIYIDVDNNSLNANEVQQIVDELQDDIVPAYFRVYIGYVNISGQFIIYDVID